MTKKIISLGVVLVMVLSLFGCSEYEYKEGDFELTISVEKTTLLAGERFNVQVELKNNSGKKRELSSVSWFTAHIPGVTDRPPRPGDSIGTEMPMPVYTQRVIKKNGTLENIFGWGVERPEGYSVGGLSPGTYEVSFRFGFIVGHGGGVITSNTIILTVG